jgi:hypothetical protein
MKQIKPCGLFSILAMNNKVLTTMRFAIICACLALFNLAQAQTTWSDDVAEIVYTNCATCHHDGGIAPFTLMSFGDALNNYYPILDAVQSGYMPPWKADIGYQEYSHERVLSAEDINTIEAWINDGLQEGNIENAPPPPGFSDEGFLTATPDLELTMESYLSQATTNADDYICVSIPSGLTQDKKIRAFEVIPGNPSIVHHCLVFIDETGNYQSNFNGNCVGPNGGLIGGYTPGAIPTIFPSNDAEFNLGMTIPAGSNIVLALHYPHGSIGEEDQTKIRFYFYDDATEIREVQTESIIQNWFFNIQANTIEEVTADFSFIPQDVSILSVFPHMHLIGESIESYAITPANDTIPFVRVSEWDFEWQQFYFFKNIQHVPAWSTIYGSGVYNNTSDNPHNPNDPPINVGAGENTSNEMFLVYFHFLAYVEGDEFYDMEELTSLPVGLAEINQTPAGSIQVFPNPASEAMQFEFNLEQSAKVSLYIYDLSGKLVDQVLNREFVGVGKSRATWDVSNIPQGVYTYSAMVNGSPVNGKLMIK